MRPSSPRAAPPPSRARCFPRGGAELVGLRTSSLLHRPSEQHQAGLCDSPLFVYSLAFLCLPGKGSIFLGACWPFPVLLWELASSSPLLPGYIPPRTSMSKMSHLPCSQPVVLLATNAHHFLYTKMLGVGVRKGDVIFSNSS